MDLLICLILPPVHLLLCLPASPVPFSPYWLLDLLSLFPPVSLPAYSYYGVCLPACRSAPPWLAASFFLSLVVCLLLWLFAHHSLSSHLSPRLPVSITFLALVCLPSRPCHASVLVFLLSYLSTCSSSYLCQLMIFSLSVFLPIYLLACCYSMFNASVFVVFLLISFFSLDFLYPNIPSAVMGSLPQTSQWTPCPKFLPAYLPYPLTLPSLTAYLHFTCLFFFLSFWFLSLSASVFLPFSQSLLVFLPFCSHLAGSAVLVSACFCVSSYFLINF